ncbi:malonyl-CoA decarboxylase family protein [Hydrogenophaga sp.]|uniref:malonyl-CoA decarboxylase domain-containing protein n=1 Tax=Hydrogenophaga sp. TaxID=1904254 RepID=UPI002618EAC3|nr:malonyl-CoA decarboxylase family protein [Hydrogenophaga sp.]MCW5652860.1 malonyl-CoA decarboxylase family protein [Hydrogenophaga sp.]
MNTGTHTTTEWLARSVSRLRPSATRKQGPRSTQERLKATLRQDGEAMSPRALRQALKDLKGIVDPMVSEVEGGRRAQAVMDWHAQAEPALRRDLWLLMSEHFVADPERVQQAQAQYAAAVGTPDEAAAEVLYRRATVSPRRRLLQRFSANPDGVRFLVDLRAQMQPLLRSDRRLLALDVEMEYMFSTWFDVGFLALRRITWDSPASLVEKLIKYEAVHDIRSWADVKNRLDSDRRCYGFFHPSLPEEPLIFVEVALMNEIASSITPLLDEAAAPADLDRATTAIFYSISNTQTGLRGVSFGDSLIKRVVDTLNREFPRLRHFATLSPIPGLRAWLNKAAPAELLKAWEHVDTLEEDAPERRALLGWAARYLGRELQDGKPLDPVARFHLGNGARVERLNWAADPSAKGMRQSYGLMVNYLYDLKRLDKHRALLAQGKVPLAAAIKDLDD